MIADEIVDVLAVARITRLMTTDRVPFGTIRSRIEKRAWEKAPPDEQINRVDPYIVEWLSCPWCMSVWVAFAVVLVLRHLPGWRWAARALAASYVTGFLAAREE